VPYALAAQVSPPRSSSPHSYSLLVLAAAPGAHAAKGYGGAPSSPTGGVGLELRRDISGDGWLPGAAFVLAALPRQAAASARAARSTDRRGSCWGPSGSCSRSSIRTPRRGQAS
jgi:hypothetical protein